MEKAAETIKTSAVQQEEYINRVGLRDKLRHYKKRPKSLVMMILVMLSAAFAVGILLFLVAYILANGIPHLTAEQFEWKYTPENQSMTPALINTLTMTLITLLIAVPVATHYQLNERRYRANPLKRPPQSSCRGRMSVYQTVNTTDFNNATLS